MNPYAIIAALVICAASLAGVGYWQYQAGVTSERAMWQGKQNAELAQANAQIISINNAARAAEQKHAQDQSDISAQYEKDKQNEKNRTDRLIADMHAGTFRLRDPDGASLQAGRCGTGQASTSTGIGDGKASGELSGQASEFLLNLAGEADEIANQLDACQQIIIDDRITK